MKLEVSVEHTVELVDEGLRVSLHDSNGELVGATLVSWAELEWAFEDAVMSKKFDDHKPNREIEEWLDGIEGKIDNVIERAWSPLDMTPEGQRSLPI